MNRILSLAPSATILLALAGCSDAHVEAKPESAAVSASSPAVASGSAMPLPTSTAAPRPTPSASAAPSDADSRTLTFSTRDVVVGARYHTHLTNHVELDATIVIKTLHSVSDEDTEVDTDILAVSHGTATKAKLTYTKVARTRTMDGVSKPNPGPAAGRSYVVERVGDKVAITAADAKPLSEDELRALRTFMGSFGKPDRVAKTLAAKPRRTGDRLDDVALAMKERYDSDHLEAERPGDQSTLTDITARSAGSSASTVARSAWSR